MDHGERFCRGVIEELTKRTTRPDSALHGWRMVAHVTQNLTPGHAGRVKTFPREFGDCAPADVAARIASACADIEACVTSAEGESMPDKTISFAGLSVISHHFRFRGFVALLGFADDG